MTTEAELKEKLRKIETLLDEATERIIREEVFKDTGDPAEF